jgi:hypothetical protein
MRTVAEIRDDIDRCNWLRTHLPNLGDVLLQDRALARLQAELATAEQEAA